VRAETVGGGCGHGSIVWPDPSECCPSGQWLGEGEMAEAH
jgi:hypothetical protein